MSALPLLIFHHAFFTDEEKCLKRRIKPLLRDASYNYFFSNISVVDETDDTISLTTPHGENIANFIYYTYSSKISKLVGKNVKILTS